MQRRTRQDILCLHSSWLRLDWSGGRETWSLYRHMRITPPFFGWLPMNSVANFKNKNKMHVAEWNQSLVWRSVGALYSISIVDEWLSCICRDFPKADFIRYTTIQILLHTGYYKLQNSNSHLTRRGHLQVRAFAIKNNYCSLKFRYPFNS